MRVEVVVVLMLGPSRAHVLNSQQSLSLFEKQKDPLKPVYLVLTKISVLLSSGRTFFSFILLSLAHKEDKRGDKIINVIIKIIIILLVAAKCETQQQFHNILKPFKN